MRNFIKSLNLVALLTIITVVVSCDSNNGNHTQALTENDFVNDNSLRGDPEDGLIVTFLEAPESEMPEKDTGGLGVDEIPVSYKKTQEQTICWKDEDLGAMHFMELLDGNGAQILRVDVNGDCVTEVIEAGDYVMVIHHDGKTGTSRPVFIIPNPDDMQAADGSMGIMNRFITVLANLIQNGRGLLSKDATAQDLPDLDTLIKTGNCEDCDLRGAELDFAELDGAKLNGAKFNFAQMNFAKLNGAELVLADLRNAQMTGAKLNGAKMTEAILNSATMNAAKLIEADLSGAQMRLTNLRNADLTGATLDDSHMNGAFLDDATMIDTSLIGADLREADLLRTDAETAHFVGADLQQAILFEINLFGADLTDAKLGRAVWCDGCECARGSIGTCNGCASVDVCTF